MRIRSFMIALLMLVTLSACSSKTGETPSASVTRSGMVTVHFPQFELDVPEGWTARGNISKVYEGDGLFLLVGPVEEGSVEESAAAALELFYNTEFYREQIQFQYDSFSPGSSTLTPVKGTLQNGKNGESLPFAGAYSETPAAYFLYFWRQEDGTGMKRMEATYESFRAL